MSEYCVPIDIVEQILHRLPPKSIGKCMTVCKSWNLLIKSHSFLSSYQHRSLSSTPLFLVKNSDNQYHCLSSPTNMIECSFSSTPKYEYAFVGAVNGLVCLASCGKTKFILFNPLTRRHFQLPISHTDSGFNRYGFGFDSKKNDFKVLHMCYSTGPFNVPPKVELYSLNEGAWRDINTPFDEDLFRSAKKCCGEQLFFDDSVHWLACEINIYPNYRIVMFNVVEEKFSEMELPQVLASSFRRLHITVIDGCLSLIRYPSRYTTTFSIWMKRESWSKIYSVSLFEGGFTWQILGQSMNSEVLVIQWRSREEIMSLHSYDLKSQEMRELGVKSTCMVLCASDFTYSLFLLDKGSCADAWEQGKLKPQKLTIKGKKRQKLIDD